MGVILGGNFPDGSFLGGSYPGWEFSGRKLSGWELSWVVIVRVGVILDGNFLCWGFSGWEFSGGKHPGGSFPSTMQLNPPVYKSHIKAKAKSENLAVDVTPKHFHK